MWSYSQKLTWLPLYIALLGVVIYKWRKQSVWILLAVIVCVGLSDIISSSIIKPLVERPRPTRVPELEGLLHIVNGYTSGRFGFVSSHAANSFGLAMLFALLCKHEKFTLSTLFIWAALNAYSRIYLGVHYPGDILGGTVVGISMAFICYGLLKKFRPKAIAEQEYHETPMILKCSIWFVWLATVFVIAL